MGTFVHFVFDRNVPKIILFSNQFNSCLPVSFTSILITMLQKKNSSTVQEFRSLRFQGHNYHEDGKRINLNFPRSRRPFWQRANIENESQILHIVVKHGGGHIMFGNEWCMVGSEGWLLLVYEECPSRLVQSHSAKRNHLKGCRLWS
jgi:hypothetical protein